MITDEQIRSCTGTDEFIPFLRTEFQAKEYAAVIRAIERFLDSATANRSWARTRLTHMLKPFAHNYIVGAIIHRGSVTDWAIRFPELLKVEGVPTEETWEAFVEEAARRGPEAFAAAMDVLRRTCERIEAEA